LKPLLNTRAVVHVSTLSRFGTGTFKKMKLVRPRRKILTSSDGLLDPS